MSTVIRIYQTGFPTDQHRDTDGTYKVNISERGHLRVEVSGNIYLYNESAWHGVDIIKEPTDA